MTMDAMRLFRSGPVTLGVANGADRLDVIVMVGAVAQVVVVFVSTFTFGPDMPAINAREFIRMFPPPSSYFNIDAAARLLLVSVPRRDGGRSRCGRAHIRNRRILSHQRIPPSVETRTKPMKRKEAGTDRNSIQRETR